MSQRVSIETPHGTANVLLQDVPLARGALLLGHGAGGSVSAADLQVAARVALEDGWTVGLVEQPYRVQGKKSPPPAPKLDEAWLAVVNELALEGPLVVGGRSSGARVACRTAAAAGAVGVLCLAFPMQPPPRYAGATPADRLAELNAVQVPVLIVQGENDQFGMPPEGPNRQVVRIRGDHSLKSDPAALAEAVRAWLASLSL